MRLLLLCLLLLPLPAFAQDSAYIREVRSYVAYVDTLAANNLEMPHDLQWRLQEGNVTFTDENHQLNGGFSIQSISNRRGDTTLYIGYHCNVPINVYKRYYFRQQHLVYAILSVQSAVHWPDQYYLREECFLNGHSLQVKEQATRDAVQYCDMVNLDTYEDGMKYLLESTKEGDPFLH